jgi:hypothetical protein
MEMYHLEMTKKFSPSLIGLRGIRYFIIIQISSDIQLVGLYFKTGTL